MSLFFHWVDKADKNSKASVVGHFAHCKFVVFVFHIYASKLWTIATKTDLPKLNCEDSKLPTIT